MTEAGGFAELRARLAALGFRPSKRLGQNFLVDPNLCAAIAAALPGPEAAVVLEIGAGPGTLTRRLAGRADVVAVEIDPRLVRFLEEDMKGWGGVERRVRVVAGDVLEGGALSPACRAALDQAGAGARGWVCVSNLPYSVAGPCLAALIQAPSPPADGLVLAQAEMGRRLLAGSGGSAYGTLSVLGQVAFRPSLLRRVPASVFRPRPRVESVLVRLGPGRPWLRRPAAERSAFGAFLQALFGARRKVVRNALSRVTDADPAGLVRAQGLPAAWLRLRPEQLEPDDLVALFAAVGV